MSPCISICRLNTLNGFCQGCWRTREEIAGWMRMSNEEKQNVLVELHSRRAANGGLRHRRGRRSRRKYSI